MSKEYKKLNLDSEIWKRLKEAKENPIGFRCWDCGEIIERLDLQDKSSEVAPVDIEGYRMLICKTCCEID